MKATTKKTSFWNSELPLTSKRANYILSRPVEAKNLIKAVRASRTSTEKVVIKFSSQKIAKEVLEI